jgi:pilus assembly protein CpaB
MRARRRRGILLLLLALASGGLAATQIRERESKIEAQIGPLVPVVVAGRDIAADDRLRAGDLSVRRVPARFVPGDALGSPARLVGARAAVPIRAGSYVTAGVLQGAEPEQGGGPLRSGERALEVAVKGGTELLGAARGSRVDVLVSTQLRQGAGRTFVALESVELLDLRASADASSLAAADDSADASAATALATLRVSLRQAVYLAAAENFGHEVRLLLRPAGDDRRVGSFSVGEGEL